MSNKYEDYDDEYGDLPKKEKIVRGGKRDREQDSLTNHFVYGVNRRNSAKNELKRIQRRLEKYGNPDNED